MTKTHSLILIYIVLVIAQLAVPVKTIIDKQNLISHAREYKFKVVPVDPQDPFRGSYVSLMFEEQLFQGSPGQSWNYGEDIFLTLTDDDRGFARILNVFKEAPDSELYYLKATVQLPPMDNQGKGSIALPFDRFYMQEFDAPRVEEAFRNSSGDSTQVQYATVLVYKGEGILSTLYINDSPVKDFLK